MGLLKRKARNKRIRPRNVLEVKLSTAQVRRHRFRLLFYTTAASLGVVFVLYVCWRAGESLLNLFIYDNQQYALQVLDIQTDGVIAPDQIERWAGVRKGDNLFQLDLARIKRDVELAPAIEAAVVERVLPQTLRLRVEEREPVAQVMTAVLRGPNVPAQNSVFLLDAQGYVLLPLSPSQRAVPLAAAEQYPILVGASAGQFSPGRRVDSPQVRAALRLLAAFDRSPMAGLVELSRIDVSSPEVLILTTDQQSEVAVRVEDLERQLNRWRLIYEVGLSQGRRIASLDLSVMENIPLRWQDEAQLAPPAPPKIKKTSPYKKRHV